MILSVQKKRRKKGARGMAGRAWSPVAAVAGTQWYATPGKAGDEMILALPCQPVLICLPFG